MLELAAHQVSVRVADLDTDPYLFNATNGTIDLRTGELLPHDKRHKITKLARVEYDLEATSAVWDKTLAEVVPDEFVRKYLRRLFGYSMIGEVIEHTYPIFYGGGRNGKGTLLETIKLAFGEYAATLASSEIIIQRNQRHPEGRANLRGARLVITSEINRGDQLDEAGIKELTGGDTIRAARKYAHEVEFQPTWLMLMQANYKPVITGQDAGIWARVDMVPFLQSFLGREDKTLRAKLSTQETLAGVLAWAVMGCLEYQARGVGIPEAISAATEAYRADSDPLTEWLDCCCEVMTPEEVKNQPLAAKKCSSTQKELFTDFRQWQEDEDGRRKTVSSTGFRVMLEERGFTRSKKRRNGSRIFLGIRLLSVYEQKAQETWSDAL
jgi:putative DNA primase/helicase